MHQVFEPTFNGESYRVFISKSINKEERHYIHYLMKVQLNAEISSLFEHNYWKKLIYDYFIGDFGKFRETLNKTKFVLVPNKVQKMYQGEQHTECRCHRGERSKKTSHYIKCLKTARKNFPEFHAKVTRLIDLVDSSAEIDKVEKDKSCLQIK